MKNQNKGVKASSTSTKASMKSEMKLYHITHPRNVDSIKKNGLKCSEDGYIYLVENKAFKHPNTCTPSNTFNEVAWCKVTDKYVPIEVDTDGLLIEEYSEGEYIDKWCHCVKTSVISADRLTFGETFVTQPIFELDPKVLDLVPNHEELNIPLVEKDESVSA